MTRKKRKNKNIIIGQEAYDFLKNRMRNKIIPYNPTIVDDKIFVTTAEEEEDELKRD